MSEILSDVWASRIGSSTGLKLVLKRRPDDIYEVKSLELNGTLIDQNNNTILDTARPKRAAAQKVRFIFSDEEKDCNEFQNSKSKRPRSLTHPETKKPNEKKNNLSYADLDDSDREDRENHPAPVQPVIKPKPIQKKVIKKIAPSKPKPVTLPQCKEILEPIHISETRKVTYLDLIAIIRRQPVVSLNHSQPFPIALIDNRSNTIRTAAVLFIHLFRTYNSPCIHCTLCRDFMAVIDFQDHIHNRDDDEDDDDEENNDSKSKHTIIPYKNCELTDDEKCVWKTFIYQYKTFKEEFTKKKEIEDAINLANRVKMEEEAKRARLAKEEAIKRQYQQVFLPRKSRQIITVTTPEIDLSQQVAVEIVIKNNGEPELNEFSQQSSNTELEMSIEESEPKRFFNEDLSLSEDESEKCEDMPKDIDILNEKSIENNSPISPLKTPQRKPTSMERYFNMYDNLPKHVLLYICDNQFTIIPDTFIRYINSKKELKSMYTLTKGADNLNRTRLSYCNSFDYDRS